jgi:hypothetical protein
MEVIISLGFLSTIIGIVSGSILGYLLRDHDSMLDKDILDKVEEIPNFIESAGEKIKIATDFDKRFFGNERVIESFKKALEKGVKVQILTEGNPLKEYEEMKKMGMKIKRVQRLPQHFMVLGIGAVRLEKPHEPGKFGRRKGDIGIIYKDCPKLAEACSEKFDQLWKKYS